MEMKKIVAVIVATIFVFAMTSATFAAGEKAETAEPSENTPAEVTKTPAPAVEKMETPGKLNEPEQQEELKESTPEQQDDQEDQEN
jgi:hypothetical protein